MSALNIILIGAHPDDCELFGGGTAALFSRMGHRVKFISMTDGSAGHHQLTGTELVERRSLETIAAADILGISYEILGNPDGQLMPTLENRHLMIQRIREWEADVVISHRPNDYHPDHRYTSQIVQDAAYMVMVPHVVRQAAPLTKNPLFLYFRDRFQKPTPFSPDIAVAIDEVYEQKMQALHAHGSQFYEWLPWIERQAHTLPEDTQARIAWLKAKWTFPLTPLIRHSLQRWYGPEQAAQVQQAEAFEIGEYGLQPDESEIRRLFPMLGLS